MSFLSNYLAINVPKVQVKVNLQINILSMYVLYCKTDFIISSADPVVNIFLMIIF